MTTAQEVFNTAYIGLIRQGVRSEAGGKCLYRGPEGLKCAVGMCITDAEYSQEMDNPDHGSTDVEHLERVRLLPDRLIPHVELLNALQDIHDCADPVDWKSKLERLAVRFALIIPEIPQ